MLIARIQGALGGSTWLFEHHGRPYERTSITNRIKKEAVRVLGRPVTAHDLRHSFATHAVSAGIDLKALSNFLGHSSVSTTGNLYVHTEISVDQYRSLMS